MGVARYKSTGDMLAGEKQVKSNRKEVISNYEGVETDEELELARRKPLLMFDKHEEKIATKWKSCKLLGQNNNDETERRRYDFEREQHEIEFKKWTKQQYSTESLTDFLTLKLQHEEEEGEGKKLKRQSCDSLSRVGKVKHFELKGNVVSYDVGSSNFKKRLKIVGARRRRVGITSSSSKVSKNEKLKLASLSLSSPVLLLAGGLRNSANGVTRWNEQQQQSIENGETESPVRVDSSSLRMKEMATTTIGQFKDNGELLLQDDLDSVVVVRAFKETKPNKRDKQEFCPVDVYELERQQQQQHNKTRAVSPCENFEQHQVAVSVRQQQQQQVAALGAATTKVSTQVDIGQRGRQTSDASDNGLLQTGEGVIGSADNEAGVLFYNSQHELEGNSWISANVDSQQLTTVPTVDNSEQQQHKQYSSHYAQFQSAATSANNEPTLFGCAVPGGRQSLLTVLVGEKGETDGSQKWQQSLARETGTNATNGNNNVHQQSTREVVTNNTNNSKLMADLNSTAKKVMGSYWRHALHPNNSRCYKVAERHHEQGQSALTSGLHRLECLDTEGIEQVGQESTSTQLNAGKRNILRQSRFSRSPISLRRQTNARLTRHRLKIQQQRQEQLAQLALRERFRLSKLDYRTGTNRANHHQQTNCPSLQTNTEELNIEQEFAQKREDQHRRKQANKCSLVDPFNNSSYRLPQANNYGDRSEFTRTNQNLAQLSTTRQQNSIPVYENQLGFRLANFDNTIRSHQEQHQVIYPSTSRAIEICDSQTACASRQNQHMSISTCQTSEQSRGLPTGGNVIVYRSIDMLRNGSSSEAGASRQDSRASQHSKKVNEEIDFEETRTISSSGSTMSLNRPFCKICHLGSSKDGDKLISPCKCSGTMQYIHCGCLLKWLEISNRTNEKPMSCELCAHEYTWHKKFNYSQVRWPKCSIKDTILHLIFIIAIGVMIFSAIAPILYRKPNDSNTTSDQQQMTTSSYRTDLDKIKQQSFGTPVATFHHPTLGGHGSHLANNGRLAHDEKFMLICAASFFLSFFIAIYVQTKARDTLYNLFVKFLSMNQTYYITEYDHEQLNSSGSNNSNAGNNTCGKHQQQCSEDSRFDRKSSQKS